MKQQEVKDAIADADQRVGTCLDVAAQAFRDRREAIVGKDPATPPASVAPVQRSALADAQPYEIVVTGRDGEISVPTFEVTSVAEPIRTIKDVSHSDRDTLCNRTKFRDLYWDARAGKPVDLASVRAAVVPPALVLLSWRWCVPLSGAPVTCSVGLTWMRLPSRDVVANATGTATFQAGFSSALDLAQQRAAAVVATWR